MWTSPNLVLRPVTLEDLSLLETWDNVIRPDSYNFFSLNRSEKLSERFSRDGFLSETSGKLVLCLRDEATTPIGSLEKATAVKRKRP